MLIVRTTVDPLTTTPKGAMIRGQTNKQRTMTYIPPQLGDTKVWVTKTETGWTVQVVYYKENTLRGDCYWETKKFRNFKKEKDAKTFASRFN